jgi:hypothetical protein
LLFFIATMTDVSALDCSDTVAALPFRKASKTEVEWVLSAVAANNGGTFHFRTEDRGSGVHGGDTG